MESNTNPKGEAKQPSNKPAKPRKTKSKQVWKNPTYIKGFGTVGPGEEVTAEQRKAWKAATDVPIDGYVEKA